MSQIQYSVLTKLSPVKPDSMAELRRRIQPAIQQALQKAGKEHLLRDGEIQISLEQNFPLEAMAIALVIKIVGDIAMDAVREWVYPKLKSMCDFEEVKVEEGGNDPLPPQATPDAGTPPEEDASN